MPTVQDVFNLTVATGGLLSAIGAMGLHRRLERLEGRFAAPPTPLTSPTPPAASLFDHWLQERTVREGRTLTSELLADYRAWRAARDDCRHVSERAFIDGLQQRQVLFAGPDGQGGKYRTPISLKGQS